MNKLDLTYPIIILKENSAPIYFMKSNFGLISKGGNSFYKNLTIYEANKSFIVKKIRRKKKAPFIKSILYFQPMYILEVELVEIEPKTLNELKKILKEHISKHPKYWLKLDGIQDLYKRIDSITSFHELCVFFK